MINTVKRSLSKQVIVIMIGTSIVLALSISIFMSIIIHSAMYNGYINMGYSISESIADSSVHSISTKQFALLQSVVNKYTKIEGVSYVIILNQNDHIISHTFTPHVPSVLYKIINSALKKNNSVEYERITLHDKEVLNIRTPLLDGYLGYANVGMDLHIIYAYIYKSILFILSIFLVLFTLCSLLVIYFVKKLTRPIQKLTLFANDLGSHDFTSTLANQHIQSIVDSREDEIGILGSTMITLESKLIEKIEDLKHSMANTAKMENEMQIARSIQQGLLPTPDFFDDSDSLDGMSYIEEVKRVGGDFYLYFYTKERNLCFAIGDVSGKGVTGALFMSATMTLLQSTAEYYSDTSTIVNKVNRQLCERNDNFLFVTLFLGVLNVTTGELHYVNAGHLPPLIKSSSGKIRAMPMTNGVALGIDEHAHFQTNLIELDSEDTILLFTDGITEAENNKLELYGDERLLDSYKTAPTSNCKDITTHIIKDLKSFTKSTPQNDDITLLCLNWRKKESLMTNPLNVHFENSIKELKTLQEVVHLFVSTHSISQKTEMNLNLVLEELLTNIIYYGYHDHDTHFIYMTFLFENNTLTVTVSDDGIPYNPLTSEEIDTTQSIEDLEVGGLGIHFVKTLMDTFDYKRENNKNIITLTVKSSLSKET